MNIKESLSSFLYDKSYFISMYENYIYVFQYASIESFSNTKIVLKMVSFKLNIEGRNLKIEKMNKDEILISGSIEKVINE